MLPTHNVIFLTFYKQKNSCTKKPKKIYEIKIKIKHLEYQVGTCAASPCLDGASQFPFGCSVSVCILWLLSLVMLPLLNVTIMWMRGLWNMYQGRGGRR